MEDSLNGHISPSLNIVPPTHTPKNNNKKQQQQQQTNPQTNTQNNNKTTTSHKRKTNLVHMHFRDSSCHVYHYLCIIVCGECTKC